AAVGAVRDPGDRGDTAEVVAAALRQPEEDPGSLAGGSGRNSGDVTQGGAGGVRALGAPAAAGGRRGPRAGGAAPRARGCRRGRRRQRLRSEEHTSELQSPCNLVCRLLLEK